MILCKSQNPAQTDNIRSPEYSSTPRVAQYPLLCTNAYFALLLYLGHGSTRPCQRQRKTYPLPASAANKNVEQNNRPPTNLPRRVL